MFQKKREKSVDMTTGGVVVPLVLFALPLVAGSIFQQLYNTADMLFVGNLVGKNAAAAVGASGILVTCLIGLFTGISVGAGVAVAQCVGADDKAGIEKLGHTSIAFCVLFGILLTILGIAAAPGILRLMNTPEDIMKEAADYIRLYFVGLLPMILYNVGAGILRACGDSKTPFYILAAGGFLNVAVDAVMIGALHMEVKGAALATTISQTFSAGAALVSLYRGNPYFRLEFKKTGFHWGSLKKILIFGLPAGIQSMVITLSNMVVQIHINGFGTNAVAAFSTYFRLESFAYLPVLAFGQAATTFAGQNMGAGNLKRVRKGAAAGAALSAVFVAVIAFSLLALGSVAVGWFVKDEAVIAIGIQIISVTFPFYWLNSLIEVFSGTIRGMGKSFISMVIILLSLCGLRIILLTVLDLCSHRIPVMASVYPITWAAAAACLFIALQRILKKTETTLNRKK